MSDFYMILVTAFQTHIVCWASSAHLLLNPDFFSKADQRNISTFSLISRAEVSRQHKKSK